MTKEPLPPSARPIEVGDTRQRVERGPFAFDHGGYRYSARRGELVSVLYEVAEGDLSHLRWFPRSMRPATSEEIEEFLGPLMWWQWRRRRRLRLVGLPPVARLVSG